MKYIVSFSGGVGSALTAFIVAKTYGPENTIILFADTLIESPDLYEFNQKVVDKLGCEYIVIADGRTPWEIFRDVKFMGNSRVDPCSRILKRDLIKKWLKDNFTPEECNIFVGIDCYEEHRLVKVIENNKPYVYRSILIESNIFLDNDDKIWFCQQNDLPIPILYKIGLPHNNCGGFCVKAGLGQFKKLYEELPEVYIHHENMMEEVMKENPKLRSFLRKQVNKQQLYLTLKQYREQYLEKNYKSVEEDSQDFGGCGCAID